MKFGKRLKRQIEETLPEWRDKFLSYKKIKKLLRNASTVTEANFVRLLDSEIDKFNAFFVEQEEDFIIRHKELQERIENVIATSGPTSSRPSEVVYAAEMAEMRKDIVDFHGEMVLLENYSSINYTGLAKILKKYDKRTGRLLRLPFIEKVLKQPFFITDLVSKLIKECETTMDVVFDRKPCTGLRAAAAAGAEQRIFRNIVAALVTMREMRKGSSTYSHFSLPPMGSADADVLQSLQLPSPIAIL